MGVDIARQLLSLLPSNVAHCEMASGVGCQRVGLAHIWTKEERVVVVWVPRAFIYRRS